MRDYYDTSGLLRAYRLGRVPVGVTRTHALAEFYGILTGTGLVEVRAGHPVKVTLSPLTAAAAARRTFARMDFSDLGPTLTLAALEAAAAANVAGRSVHDWLHAAAAAATNADRIITLNRKDFERMTSMPLADSAD